MKILVINCGSSSLKFQLIDSETEKVIGKGLCERIGIDGRIKSSLRAQGLEMGLTVSPPAWQTIRYDAILVRENGRWIIRDVSQREVIR